MYISKVKIKNYRNFKDFEIDLKQFTVLIGENNIGKSNLINGIGLILSNEISFYKNRTLELNDINYEVIQEFKKDVYEKNIEDIVFPEVKIEIFFTDFKSNDEQIAVMSDWLLEDLITAKLTYCFYNRNPKKTEFLKKIKEKIEGKPFEEVKQLIMFPIEDYEYKICGGISQKRADTYFLKKLNMEILDALRDAKKELSSTGTRKLLYKILSNREIEKYSDIVEIIENMQKDINENQEEINIIKTEIETFLDKISLETETSSNKINFRFSSVELSEILKKFSLEYGDNPITIEKNGLGRNNLLYISLLLSHLLAGINKNYFRLIAIEEPEAHLSPVLQKHLSCNLAKEGNIFDGQIILTTHSTHISAHLDLENTVILYKENNEIKNHYIMSEITDKKRKKYLKKWINATNSTMFFTRKIIMVEGIAEQLIIPKLFEIYTGNTLEKYNCQLLNVNGVAFRNFLEIIKNGYFIKCSVLTDNDSGTKTEERANNLKKDYDDDKIKINITQNTSTFEKEILECNKERDYKNTIDSVMGSIRPNRYKSEMLKTTLEVEEYFQDIEKYKSEFAFELLNELEKENVKFNIPNYIKEAFDFIIGE